MATSNSNGKPTPLALVHMKKGMYRTVPTLGGNKWLGAVEGHKHWPYDKDQVKVNRQLYPHLFN